MISIGTARIEARYTTRSFFIGAEVQAAEDFTTKDEVGRRLRIPQGVKGVIDSRVGEEHPNCYWVMFELANGRIVYALTQLSQIN